MEEYRRFVPDANIFFECRMADSGDSADSPGGGESRESPESAVVGHVVSIRQSSAPSAAGVMRRGAHAGAPAGAPLQQCMPYRGNLILVLNMVNVCKSLCYIVGDSRGVPTERPL